MLFYHVKLNVIFNLINIYNEYGYDKCSKPLLALEDSEGEIYLFDNDDFIFNLEFIGVV